MKLDIFKTLSNVPIPPSEIIQRRGQASLGGGRNAPEWVAGMNRNQWPECVGIRTSRGVPTMSYEVKLSQNRPQHRAVLEERE